MQPWRAPDRRRPSPRAADTGLERMVQTVAGSQTAMDGRHRAESAGESPAAAVAGQVGALKEVLMSQHRRLVRREVHAHENGSLTHQELLLDRTVFTKSSHFTRWLPMLKVARLLEPRDPAGGPEHLRDGDGAGQAGSAGLLAPKTGEQARARGMAFARVVELREAQPFRSQAVEIRRLDLAAVTPRIGGAHVINKDEQDVRPCRFGCRGRGERRSALEQEKIEQQMFHRRMSGRAFLHGRRGSKSRACKVPDSSR